MIEIIHFYSDMGTLSHIFESVNDLAGQFNEADLSSDAIDKIGLALASSLRSLREQTGNFAQPPNKSCEKNCQKQVNPIETKRPSGETM